MSYHRNIYSVLILDKFEKQSTLVQLHREINFLKAGIVVYVADELFETAPSLVGMRLDSQAGEPNFQLQRRTGTKAAHGRVANSQKSPILGLSSKRRVLSEAVAKLEVEVAARRYLAVFR